MSSVIDDLKTVAELLEKAVELVRQAAKESTLPSVSLRQSVGKEIVRIRLQLMLLRRGLTILRDLANGRKPRVRRKEKEG